MPSPKVTAATALAVKNKLWLGQSQQTLARDLRLSQGTISRISLGLSWDDIPWPDGSTGAFPDYRKRELKGLAPPSEPRQEGATTPRVSEAAIEAALDEAHAEDEQWLKNIIKPSKATSKRSSKREG